MFFSDVTGRYSKRVLAISDSACGSSLSVGIGMTPGGKLEAGCAEGIWKVIDSWLIRTI